MRTNRRLLIEQLDKRLNVFQTLESVVIPDKGWVNAIRVSLNMTLAQLGVKLNISRQGVKSIEDNESSGSISIKSMKEVAEALDMKFVYGFSPRDGSIDNLIDKKAEQLATKIVLRANQSMQLENQGIEEYKIKESIVNLAEDIKREMRKSLWD